MEWKDKRNKMDDEIKSKIIPILKNKGFKGSYPNLRRVTEKQIDILGFQFSQWGPQFYIEIAISPLDGVTLLDGKHFSPDKIKYYQANKRKRIGNNPFDFENEDFKRIIDDITKSLIKAEEWWLKFGE